MTDPIEPGPIEPDPIEYAWRGEFTDLELNTLHAEGFEHVLIPDDWWAVVNRHSLGWVTARRAASAPGAASAFGGSPVVAGSSAFGGALAGGVTAGGELVGFVNVAWDGGVHAFILDTLAARSARREGIGTRLVEIATEHARAAGCEWLHVDFDDHLRAFYFDACGFTPTNAGLIRLV